VRRPAAGPDGPEVNRLTRVARVLDRWAWWILPSGDGPWWLYPAFLVGLAVVTLTAALLVHPVEGESLAIFGIPLDGGCSFRERTGMPCAQCGMTRSWVWAARGHLPRAFAYNPGGASLFVWILVAGVLGGVRLVCRNARLLVVDWRLLAGWVLVWMVGLNVGCWLARIAGFNPLP